MGIGSARRSLGEGWAAEARTGRARAAQSPRHADAATFPQSWVDVQGCRSRSAGLGRPRPLERGTRCAPPAARGAGKRAERFRVASSWRVIRAVLTTPAASVRLACVAHPHPYSPRGRAQREYERRPFSGSRKRASVGQGRRCVGSRDVPIRMMPTDPAPRSSYSVSGTARTSPRQVGVAILTHRGTRAPPAIDSPTRVPNAWRPPARVELIVDGEKLAGHRVPLRSMPTITIRGISPHAINCAAVSPPATSRQRMLNEARTVSARS